MRNHSMRFVLIAATTLLTCTSCGKPPEEIQAEKKRADAAWNAEVAVAERAREQDEKRLVDQQLAEHERREQVDDERERKAAEAQENAERDRLIDGVRAKFPEPQAAKFGNVRWNPAKSALCGMISVPNANGIYSEFKGFIAAGDEPVIDSENEDDHARYTSAAAEMNCSS